MSSAELPIDMERSVVLYRTILHAIEQINPLLPDQPPELSMPAAHAIHADDLTAIRQCGLQLITAGRDPHYGNWMHEFADYWQALHGDEEKEAACIARMKPAMSGEPGPLIEPFDLPFPFGPKWDFTLWTDEQVLSGARSAFENNAKYARGKLGGTNKHKGSLFFHIQQTVFAVVLTARGIVGRFQRDYLPKGTTNNG